MSSSNQLCDITADFGNDALKLETILPDVKDDIIGFINNTNRTILFDFVKKIEIQNKNVDQRIKYCQFMIVSIQKCSLTKNTIEITSSIDYLRHINFVDSLVFLVSYFDLQIKIDTERRCSDFLSNQSDPLSSFIKMII